MIFKGCPYSEQSNQIAVKEKLGAQNIIALHEVNRDQTPCHTAPFSVKYVLKGSEVYEYDSRRLTVDQHKYLVINKDQPYSSAIEERSGTISFCIFFGNSFISDAFRNQYKSNEFLMEYPHEDGEHVSFYQKLYPKDHTVKLMLNRYWLQMQEGHQLDQIETDHFCIEILGQLFIQHQLQSNQLQSLKFARLSTKQEIYKRLTLSVDFMHEYFATKISLEQLSSVSNLSVFHYHRVFREAFSCTPHEYLTRIRLEHSRQLLQSTDLPVWSVCTRSGFDDESSFIRLFKKTFAITPRLFRCLGKDMLLTTF
jgi:AraC family transcriptional regulator